MKEQIRQIVKEEVSKHLGMSNEIEQEEQVNESLLALAGIAAIGGAWAWVRRVAQNAKNDTILQSFLENYDKEKIVEKQIPETAKRFKLIKSLTDLEAMENRVDTFIKKLKALQNNVDKFVDMYFKGMEDSGNFFDRALAMKPQSEKIRIKKELKDIIENVEKSFEIEIESKKAEILG